MPRPLLSVLIWGVSGVALPLGAVAAPLQGEVTASQGRWTADGSRIVTESVIRTDAGQDVVVSQLGGTADGLTMRLFASDGRGDGVDALPLVVGARVSLEIHGAATLDGRIVHVVDRVLPGGSSDFVRTGPTKAGQFLSWASGCAQLYYDSAG
nr:hypothetical protein [Kofleriaceae bacterium]